MSTTYKITVIEKSENVEKQTVMELSEFLSGIYNSLIKTKSVNCDYSAGDRDMVEVTTGDVDVNITLETPKKGKTITIYVVKVDGGNGAVNVLAPIEKGDSHTLSSQESKQKYISIDGNPYRKW